MSSKSSLFYSAENFAVDLLMVRDDDIPTLVLDGICDIGIVGENVLLEQSNPLEKEKLITIQKLGFGRCRLSIAVPKDYVFNNKADLQGLRIATTYPQLLKNYLQENDIQAETVVVGGSVEITPRVNMSDAICDLVSTGRTLEENNLKEVLTVLQSQAVLVKKALPLSEEKNDILAILLRRMQGVLEAQECKYILFHAPKNAISVIRALLPGSETPTIVPLMDDEDKVAVHVVSTEAVFWGTIEKLRAAGASAILVLPVEKMMA
jgi:ATP phosphoribosyltransferase